MAWLIQVNGLIVDARKAPREVQEEAFRRGTDSVSAVTIFVGFR